MGLRKKFFPFFFFFKVKLFEKSKFFFICQIFYFYLLSLHIPNDFTHRTIYTFRSTYLLSLSLFLRASKDRTHRVLGST